MSSAYQVPAPCPVPHQVPPEGPQQAPSHAVPQQGPSAVPAQNLATPVARNPRATLRRLMEFKLNLKILGVATKHNKINKDDLQLWRRRSSSAQPCEKRGLVLRPSRELSL